MSGILWLILTALESTWGMLIWSPVSRAWSKLGKPLNNNNSGFLDLYHPMSKKIPLFYWSSVLFENRPAENYGDLLSKYIVEQVSGRSTVYYNAPKKRKSWFQKRHLLAIGSIMNYATAKSVVWGSGIIRREEQFGQAQFTAVRGPQTRKRVLELGYDCPEVYGDPGLLLPRFYNPEVPKEYQLGVIPHYIDFPEVKTEFQDQPGTLVVNLIGDDFLATTRQILKCEQIISSSLHGLIIAHAYGIPAIWVRFSDQLTGDNIKFQDYFESVGLEPYLGEKWEEGDRRVTVYECLKLSSAFPANFQIEAVCEKLLKAFPDNWK